MSAEKVELRLTVHNQAQARELEAAWREIVTGRKLPRIETIETDTDAIIERARVALELIENSLHANATSGQARRLVRFLAGVYNGSDYPVDLTDLRALDTELANACLDYLAYDRLGKREVHWHLSGGDRQLHEWIRDCGIEPALRLDDEQASAFSDLADRLDRSRYDLLREAVEDLVFKYRRPTSPAV